jgi:uncharacterized membrane protein (DUF373 family)
MDWITFGIIFAIGWVSCMTAFILFMKYGLRMVYISKTKLDYYKTVADEKE